MYVDGLRLAQQKMGALHSKMHGAAARAVNRVGEGIRTEAARKITETYTVKGTEVKAAITISRISESGGDLVVNVRGAPLPMIKFKVTPKNLPAKKKRQKPVAASVKKGSGGRLRSGFLARVGSGGHVGVFRRKFESGRSGRRRLKNEKGARPELPITQVHGPSVPQMIEEPGVVDHIQAEIKRRMDTRLDHEIRRAMGDTTP